MLPALSLDGILHLRVQNHPFNGDEFQEFIEELLDRMQPWPRPNSVLVMDNASIHKVPGIREVVEARYVIFLHPCNSLISIHDSGMRLVYLPTYSPDFNPIEEGFSAIKATLRRYRNYALAGIGNVRDLITQIVYRTVSQEKALGWYRSCGYISYYVN